jgi:hypothetical protein
MPREQTDSRPVDRTSRSGLRDLGTGWLRSGHGDHKGNACAHCAPPNGHSRLDSSSCAPPMATARLDRSTVNRCTRSYGAADHPHAIDIRGSRDGSGFGHLRSSGESELHAAANGEAAVEERGSGLPNANHNGIELSAQLQGSGTISCSIVVNYQSGQNTLASAQPTGQYVIVQCAPAA